MDTLPDLTYRASIRYWKKPTLDYNLYWILAVFLGWAGLDYFYLGSPLMGFAKIALTFLTFGYWWAYDALNATFNQEQVQFAGPFVPAWGPTGIGAGRFVSKERPAPSNPEQAAKHTHFLLYGLGLFTLGLFGVDSYMTGDTLSGFIRLGSLLSILFAPVAIVWYIFSLYRYTLRTDMCLDTFWDYFGAPKPADGDLCPNVLELFTVWALKTVIVVLNMIPGLGGVVSIVQGLVDSLETAYKVAGPIVIGAVNTAVDVAAKGTQVVNELQSMKMPTAEDFARAKAEHAEQGGKAAPAPAPASAPAPAPAPIPTQVGGGFAAPSTESPLNAALSLLSVGVVATVLVSAVTLTFWRAYQKVRNGSVSDAPTDEGSDKRGGEEHNDVPPDPALSGESVDE